MAIQKITKSALAFWLVVGGLIGWQLNSSLTNRTQITTTNDTQNIENDLDLNLFWDVWSSVKESYVDIDSVEQTKEVYGAVAGLVDALGDPFSVFMNPEESDQFKNSLASELEGVGMELTLKDGKLVVISPLKGSPAEKAGIRPGDFVYLVDGNPTGEMTLFEAIMAIRGTPGTEVVITVLRDGIGEPKEIPITRARINVPTVETDFKDIGGKKIAVVNLYQFGDSTSSDFSKAIRQIKLENPDAMVLDLRMNGGGYLDVAVEVMSEFFKDKLKAVIVKKRNEQNEYLYTTGAGSLSDIPLVVLIDNGSASASEILAGAIQDYKRGVLIGVQSFGKGSVQELASLPDGSSLRLTVAKWFTPNDRGIDHTGITPDIVVETDKSDSESSDDTQLQSALEYLAEH